MPTPQAASIQLPDLSGLMPAKLFREAAELDAVPEGATVAKDVDAVITKDAESGRRFNFRLTTGAVDRQNDRLFSDGWVTAEFDKSPIWLWSHDTVGTKEHTALIGLVVERQISATSIDVGVEYVPKSVNPLGESVFQMHEFRREMKALSDRGGAASVGARPLEFKFNKKRGGIDFEKSELLEGSDVMIGANQEAVGQMKAAGVDLGPVGEWAEVYRKAAGLITIDKVRADAIMRVLDPVKGLTVFEMPVAEIRSPRVDESEGLDTIDRFLSGAEFLDDAVRRALAPVLAASGMPQLAIRSEPDPPVEPPTQAMEPVPQGVTEKAIQDPVPLTEEEIDCIARAEINPLLIQRLGQPLPEKEEA